MDGRRRSPSARDVTATNGAGLRGSDSLAIVADATAPSGQSVDLAGGPWYTTTSIPLTLDDGTDAGSGVDSTSGVVERSEAALSNGGAAAPSAAGRRSRSTAGADTTVQTGTCYRYRYTVADQVGNTSAPSAASTTAKVDTTAPSVTVEAPTALTGSGAQYYDADTNTLYFRPSGSGSFALNATAADAQSGIERSRSRISRASPPGADRGQPTRRARTPRPPTTGRPARTSPAR